MKYASLPELKEAYAYRTRNALDNYTICTGVVGMWKSLWLRKFAAYVSRRKLTVAHIHFTFDDWVSDFVGLSPGDSIIRDEWDANRRMAMHGSRLEELDTNKEGRQIGANAFFAYPDAGEVDVALLKRFSWWHHKPSRQIVEIRQISTRLVFDKYGQPTTQISYPMVARFRVSGKNDPLRWEYEAKKEARMRDRNANLARKAEGGPQAQAAAAKPMINPSILAMVQAELNKP